MQFTLHVEPIEVHIHLHEADGAQLDRIERLLKQLVGSDSDRAKARDLAVQVEKQSEKLSAAVGTVNVSQAEK